MIATYCEIARSGELTHHIGFSPESLHIANGLSDIRKSEEASQTAKLSSVLLSALCRVANQVKEFGKLEDDWDGMDANAPTPEVVDEMLQLISKLDFAMRHAEIRSPLPQCCPTPDGGIQLYWLSDNFYLSLLIEPWLPGQVVVLSGDGKTSSHETHLSLNDAVTFAVERLRSYKADR